MAAGEFTRSKNSILKKKTRLISFSLKTNIWQNFDACLTHTDGHSVRGGTEVKSLFHLKALRCYFKGQGCASWVSAAEESFYLHGFIAHVGKEEEEGRNQ